MSEVTVEIQGRKYTGWKSVEIRKTIESIAGSFSLEFNDQWSKREIVRKVAPGKLISIFLDDIQVINGYIDDLDTGFSATETSSRITGRDKTGDMVDCSPRIEPGEWKNIDLLSLAQIFAAPFDLEVSVGEFGLEELFPVFTQQIGESVSESVQRAANQRGLLLTTDNNGNLQIATRGNNRLQAALVEGDNVLSARWRESWADRFSNYKVFGQVGGESFDGWSAKSRTAIVGESRDTTINRNRPRTIIAENQVDSDSAETRAEWEGTVRAAQAARLEVTAQGWGVGTDLWLPNNLVFAFLPRIGIETEFLIVSSRFSQSETEGSVTRLQLANKEAYQPKPEINVDVQKDSFAALGWR
jgi:prophage tail gpP-like protein